MNFSNKHKEKIIHNAVQIWNKNKKELKSKFELVSPHWSIGKHWIIAVSGFLSEEDDNLDAWKGLVESYYGKIYYTSNITQFIMKNKLEHSM